MYIKETDTSHRILRISIILSYHLTFLVYYLDTYNWSDTNLLANRVHFANNGIIYRPYGSIYLEIITEQVTFTVKLRSIPLTYNANSSEPKIES